MEPRHIPEWFVKELRLIDPLYYVQQSEAYENQFYVRWNVSFTEHIKIQGGKTARVHVHHPILDVFDRLDDAALNTLRRRKLEGIRLGQSKIKQLAEIHARNKAAKEKSKELALEPMAHGFMEIYNLGRRHTVTMPQREEKHEPSGPSTSDS